MLLQEVDGVDRGLPGLVAPAVGADRSLRILQLPEPPILLLPMPLMDLEARLPHRLLNSSQRRLKVSWMMPWILGLTRPASERPWISASLTWVALMFAPFLSSH